MKSLARVVLTLFIVAFFINIALEIETYANSRLANKSR